MLGSEGLQHADDLSKRLHELFDSLKIKCTKQPYYDWGLRKLKAVTREAGKVKRSVSCIDERQVVTKALQSTCAPCLSPTDEQVFLRSLIDYFGVDAFVPEHLPGDFWNATAAK